MVPAPRLHRCTGRWAQRQQPQEIHTLQSNRKISHHCWLPMSLCFECVFVVLLMKQGTCSPVEDFSGLGLGCALGGQ